MLKAWFKKCLEGDKIVFHHLHGDEVILTFDDGPHEKNTPKILDCLKRENARGIFFVNGSQVEKYPYLAVMLKKEGHGIGNHFYDHVSARHLRTAQIRNQIEETEKKISQVVGSTPMMIRPPYGDINLYLLWYAATRKRKMVMWSLDSGDGASENCEPHQILNQVYSAKAGEIILLHEDNHCTVEILPEMIASIRAKGLKISPLHSTL